MHSTCRTYALFKNPSQYSLYSLLTGIAVIAVAPGSYLRLVPHFLICETTNIFFNIAWVLRAAGMKGNPFVLLFEYLFALTFFPIRIINLTLVIWLLQAEVRVFMLLVIDMISTMSHTTFKIHHFIFWSIYCAKLHVFSFKLTSAFSSQLCNFAQ